MEPKFNGCSVLIVEDEPDNLSVAIKILTFHGAEVCMAHNGVEGLQKLEELLPDLILSDLSMPKLDGWEMLQKIRANPKYDRIPVIALTAHAMAGDKDRIMQAGFDGYIIKPFLISTFLTEIERCREVERYPQKSAVKQRP